MHRLRIGHFVQTALITAFTIAAALIWKDVIIEAIELIVPASEELLFKLLAALIATIVAVIGITAVLKTEAEAEHVFRNIGKKKRK